MISFHNMNIMTYYVLSQFQDQVLLPHEFFKMALFIVTLKAQIWENIWLMNQDLSHAPPPMRLVHGWLEVMQYEIRDSNGMAPESRESGAQIDTKWCF